MKIARHHIKGTKEHGISEIIRPAPEYTPKQPWPENCTVQWGHGIIPANPFFEAFIPGTFIRGDGATIEEAEAKAFAQYSQEGSCDHLWGRQRPKGDLYKNGAGWCRKCGAFRSKMFQSIVDLGYHRRPLSRSEEDFLHSLETDHEMNEHMDRKYPQERKNRLVMKRLLRIRKNLFGVDQTSPEWF